MYSIPLLKTFGGIGNCLIFTHYEGNYVSDQLLGELTILYDLPSVVQKENTKLLTPTNYLISNSSIRQVTPTQPILLLSFIS